MEQNIQSFFDALTEAHASAIFDGEMEIADEIEAAIDVLSEHAATYVIAALDTTFRL